MTLPDSVCARVIKGKYYPNGEFSKARKKRNSSHTWRALLTGRGARHCGLTHHIVDGESTNQDRWILGAISGKPIYVQSLEP
jgi:hypothetical protein